ncbi:MAG: DEAD/DEAH box helicase, partial [Carnobacterium maltaromaticum]
MNSKPQLIKQNGRFKFIDSNDGILRERKIERLFEKYRAFFDDLENLELSSDLNYLELTELINKINDRMQINLDVSNEIQRFITQSRYVIEEQRIVGLTIKEYDKRWSSELQLFQEIIDTEIFRPLKSQQVQASFFLTMMKRAANFSVPGAGKTAMMYGTFAYLSSLKINKVDKVLVIAPLNAFESWRTEFKEVFGEKRVLYCMNLKDYNNVGDIRTNWSISNLLLLNYEAISDWKLAILNELIDEKTLLVFDEVHRIKNPEGKRAKKSLDLGKQARYRYVLTGTPIPNSYKDIYNFLHLLYGDEYNSFFGWNIPNLESANAAEVNEKLQPFFWRTNKKDLNVPPADKDNILVTNPNETQQKIVEMIYEIESNILCRYIRLLQASTNPSLLTEKINLQNLGFVLDEIDLSIESTFNSEEKTKVKQKMYFDLGVENMRTPKFEKGMELIYDLVSRGKKVIVWGMFIGTMKKIHKELHDLGVLSHLIYGATDKDSRVELINEFRDGDVQVLISNPATLGESISLHQTVHDAIYFEYNFNLTFMLQSRDRIHRLGLSPEQYTRYYYLMTAGSSAHKSFIDRQVYARLKGKEEI